MPAKNSMESPEQNTRSNLVQTGLKLFSTRGYDATSIRKIAAEADSNLAAVHYHFGNKEGLRMACAEHIGSMFQSVAGQLLGLTFLSPQSKSTDQELTAEAAREQLLSVPEGIANLLLNNPKSKYIAPFLFREMSHPSPAIDLIYANVIEPVHTRLCYLWAVATGEDPDSEEVRLRIFSLLGQVVYFRLAQEIIVRRMDWQSVSEDELTQITKVIRENLEAILQQRSTSSGQEKT